MSFDDLVAQLAHFAWGALLFLLLAQRMNTVLAGILIIVFFLGKEAIESLWGVWEPVQPWLSGVKDSLFWTIGLIVGILAKRFTW